MNDAAKVAEAKLPGFRTSLGPQVEPCRLRRASNGAVMRETHRKSILVEYKKIDLITTILIASRGLRAWDFIGAQPNHCFRLITPRDFVRSGAAGVVEIVGPGDAIRGRQLVAPDGAFAIRRDRDGNVFRQFN